MAVGTPILRYAAKKLPGGVLTLSVNNNEDNNPVHAPNQEFDEIVINRPPIKVDKNKIFVEVWVIRREKFILYKWGMNPLGVSMKITKIAPRTP